MFISLIHSSVKSNSCILGPNLSTNTNPQHWPHSRFVETQALRLGTQLSAEEQRSSEKGSPFATGNIVLQYTVISVPVNGSGVAFSPQHLSLE